MGIVKEEWMPASRALKVRMKRCDQRKEEENRAPDTDQKALQVASLVSLEDDEDEES